MSKKANRASIRRWFWRALTPRLSGNPFREQRLRIKAFEAALRLMVENHGFNWHSDAMLARELSLGNEMVRDLIEARAALTPATQAEGTKE